MINKLCRNRDSFSFTLRHFWPYYLLCLKYAGLTSLMLKLGRQKSPTLTRNETFSKTHEVAKDLSTKKPNDSYVLEELFPSILRK